MQENNIVAIEATSYSTTLEVKPQYIQQRHSHFLTHYYFALIPLLPLPQKTLEKMVKALEW